MLHRQTRSNTTTNASLGWITTRPCPGVWKPWCKVVRKTKMVKGWDVWSCTGSCYCLYCCSWHCWLSCCFGWQNAEFQVLTRPKTDDWKLSLRALRVYLDMQIHFKTKRELQSLRARTTSSPWWFFLLLSKPRKSLQVARNWFKSLTKYT